MVPVKLPRPAKVSIPGSALALQELRKAGDLDTLRSYFEDPEASLRKRRRAVHYFCTCAPGGGGSPLKLTPVDPAVIPTCIKLLETETDPNIRRWAAYGLRQSGDPEAEKALIMALDSEDTATRHHALIGLTELGSSAAVDAVAAQLGDSKARKTAIRVLVRIRDPAGAEHLREAAAADPSAARLFIEAAEEIESAES